MTQWLTNFNAQLEKTKVW